MTEPAVAPGPTGTPMWGPPTIALFESRKLIGKETSLERLAQAEAL